MISGNLPRFVAVAILIVGLAGCAHKNEAGQTEGSVVEMYGTVDVGVGSTSTR
ncbi:hypothetical protein BOTU111922_10340 [Bordetella tumulicola]